MQEILAMDATSCLVIIIFELKIAFHKNVDNRVVYWIQESWPLTFDARGSCKVVKRFWALDGEQLSKPKRSVF